MHDVQNQTAPQIRRFPFLFFSTAALVIFFDWLTKLWIRTNLEIGEVLWEYGVIRIVRIPPNTGAAFGIFRGNQYILAAFSAVSAVAIIVCVVWACRRLAWLSGRLAHFGFGLILGGTIGNLIERANPNLGGVTDFVSVGIWPAFNIADASIVCGIAVFAFHILRLMRDGKF